MPLVRCHECTGENVCNLNSGRIGGRHPRDGPKAPRGPELSKHSVSYRLDGLVMQWILVRPIIDEDLVGVLTSLDYVAKQICVGLIEGRFAIRAPSCPIVKEILVDDDDVEASGPRSENLVHPIQSHIDRSVTGGDLAPLEFADDTVLAMQVVKDFQEFVLSIDREGEDAYGVATELWAGP